MNITWPELAQAAGSQGLVIFNQTWYEGRQIDDNTKEVLAPVFDRFPLGTTNFKVWLKQRTRQLFERSLKDA